MPAATGREGKNMKVSVMVWIRNIAMNVIEPYLAGIIIRRANFVTGEGIIRYFSSPAQLTACDLRRLEASSTTQPSRPNGLPTFAFAAV